MERKKLLNRISVNPKVMVGQAVIKGTRLTVHYILGQLGQGVSMEEIMEEYKGLKKEDIHACLLFASQTMEDSTYLPLVEKAV